MFSPTSFRLIPFHPIAVLALMLTGLLAPGEARAAQECGGPQMSTLTCSMTSYTDGIYYGGSANEVYGSGGTTLNIAGSGTATTTITSGASQAVGVHVDTLAGQNRPFTLNIGGATGGTAHIVNIVQGTNTNTDANRNNGVYILDRGQFSATMVDLERGVTIGSSTTSMKQHGIQVQLDGSGLVGTGEADITSAANIFAAKRGIWVRRNPGTTTATNSATTITNSGDIRSGETGIYLDYSAATSNTHTRGATITNTGAITVSGAADGIRMAYRSLGDAKITNRGDIIANAATSNGILMQHTGSAGGATVINSGDITSHALAISVKTSKKIAAGTTADASVIHEGGAIDVSNHAGILVEVGEEDDTTANNAGDAELTVMGGSVEARDEALVARNRQAGNVVIEVSEGVTLTSRDGHGILGDLPASNEKGGVTITNAAAITAAEVGILVRRTAPANAGIISITNHGAIKRTGDGVDFAGIRVEDDKGKGHVTVENSGDIGEAGAMAMYLHGIQVQKTGSSGDISVTTTGGSIIAKDRGIYVTDNAGHVGAVTISNGGDITADRPIYVNRVGEGPVTITNTGGTVRTESSHAIFAFNKTGDASDVRVNMKGGTAQSSLSTLTLDRVNVVHAFNRGTGDVIVDITDGALISRVSEAVYANLDSTLLALDNQVNNQVKITQGGRMMGRTGVYARAGGYYSVAAEGEDVAARAEEKPNVIDVTWTGSFSHGTTDAEKALVAQNDEGRFSAANVLNLVVFSQNIEAERATDGLYGSAAGVEAAVMPRRIADSTGIIQVVAGSDVPGEFPDAAAQTALLAETGDASRRTAILAQFRAMLGNEEIDAASVLTAIDSTATTVADLSDEEILNYLGADTPGARSNLYNGLFGLSEAEQAILRAVATGGDVDAALRAAGFTDDPDDDTDYWSRVKALLNRYNPGNVNVAMNGGTIDSRGDGIRAYYATPHANNGAINVTVAAGTTVTAANRGIYVANAGMDEGNIQQTVTVHGMVTGGTAGVHLAGGGMVTVGKTGRIGATSGDGILSDGGDLSVSVAGMVEGDIRATGGALTFASLTGSQVTGTVHDPIGPLTVSGSIGRLLYTAGGAVTVASGGRLTGDEGEAIRSESGDLSVTVAKGASITAGTGIYVANAGSGVRVVNRGTIKGGEFGIRVLASRSSHQVESSIVRNYGVVESKVAIEVPAGNTVEHLGGRIYGQDRAILFRGPGGNSKLVVKGDAILDGDIEISGIVDFQGACANNLNYDFVKSNISQFIEPKPNTHDDCDGPINHSAFALTDDMLSDLTGSIHGAVAETEMRPGAVAAGQVVWATPFGGARDQNGANGVMDATHTFGGGLVGTSWGAQDVRVGGFIGGSVGQIDTQSNVSVQEQNMDVQTIFGGLYASRARGNVLYNARMLFGQMTHDFTRRVPSMENVEVEYSSFFLSPEVGMAGRLYLTSKRYVLPRVRLRYAGLFTEGFRERAMNWDVQFEKRTMQLVEGRAEVGVPFTLDNGGQINPRVGVEGRWLLSGSKIKARSFDRNRDRVFSREAGGDDTVVTGTVGFGMSVPVADSMALVGSFDGAVTTEEAWRALGYLGLTYSF